MITKVEKHIVFLAGTSGSFSLFLYAIKDHTSQGCTVEARDQDDETMIFDPFFWRPKMQGEHNTEQKDCHLENINFALPGAIKFKTLYIFAGQVVLFVVTDHTFFYFFITAHH